MPSNHNLPRSQWLKLLRTGLGTGAWDFVRQAADAYLTHIPNDLEIRLLQAEALMHLGHHAQAFAMASAVALADPEDAHAHRLCWQTLPAEAPARQREAILGALAALGSLPAGESAPAWSAPLAAARRALQAGEAEAAQQQLFSALPGNDHIPLLAVAHLQLVNALGDWVATLHLARTYHQRWPQTLAIRLILAHHLAESGQETQSVALLHATAAEDPAGQVVRRVFGAQHPYAALWPQNLAAPLEIPLPAAVAAALGHNRLPGATLTASKTAPKKESPPQKPEPQPTATPPPQPKAPPPPPQEAPPPPPPSPEKPPQPQGKLPAPTPPRRANRKHIRQAEKALSKAARRLKIPHLANTDGRFPVYVILSTRRGLAACYGEETAKIVVRHMHTLAKTVAASPDWDALVLLADDPASAREHGVRPVSPNDPWEIKNQLAALDQALARQGSMIGALLIVGGHEVVPFHHLPNPVEDDDQVVPSDNPYGTTDENYLAPTWPVGRLPDSADGDAALLLGALRRMTEAHRARRQRQPWHRRWWQWLKARLALRRQRSLSAGYTAAVWEKAAQAVFKEIGSSRALLTSPPLDTDSLGVFPRAKLAYFNLHGTPDAPAWYGQRSAADADAPPYPVALRPEDIPPRGHAAEAIFSEACYGAHIDQKTPQTALCLRFLYAGARVFVGSTVTAYGAVAPPLGGADLLGHLFWRRLKAGLPAGEALRQAKYLYVQTMHQRHGFLDADDHKTLISFVLYGDPLHAPFAATAALAKGIARPRHSTPVAAAEERAADGELRLPTTVSKQIRELVQSCLPGAEGLQMLMAEDTVEIAPKGKGAKRKRVARKVVVVRKSDQLGEIKHRHYMRVALEANGKVAKVMLSR